MDQRAKDLRTGSPAERALALLKSAFERDTALEARVAGSDTGRFSAATFPPHAPDVFPEDLTRLAP